MMIMDAQLVRRDGVREGGKGRRGKEEGREGREGREGSSSDLSERSCRVFRLLLAASLRSDSSTSPISILLSAPMPPASEEGRSEIDIAVLLAVVLVAAAARLVMGQLPQVKVAEHRRPVGRYGREKAEHSAGIQQRRSMAENRASPCRRHTSSHIFPLQPNPLHTHQ